MWGLSELKLSQQGVQESLEKLFGTTLHLSASTIELTFPSAYERLHSTFFRTKVTSWMAAQEEDYRCLPCLAQPSFAPAQSMQDCLPVLMCLWQHDVQMLSHTGFGRLCRF